MSTIQKLNPRVRVQRGDRAAMMRALGKPEGSRTAPMQILRSITFAALWKLRGDHTRTGAAKERIYQKILKEYMENASRFETLANMPVPPAPPEPMAMETSE